MNRSAACDHAQWAPRPSSRRRLRSPSPGRHRGDGPGRWPACAKARIRPRRCGQRATSAVRWDDGARRTVSPAPSTATSATAWRHSQSVCATTPSCGRTPRPHPFPSTPLRGASSTRSTRSRPAARVARAPRARRPRESPALAPDRADPLGAHETPCPWKVGCSTRRRRRPFAPSASAGIGESPSPTPIGRCTRWAGGGRASPGRHRQALRPLPALAAAAAPRAPARTDPARHAPPASRGTQARRTRWGGGARRASRPIPPRSGRIGTDGDGRLTGPTSARCASSPAGSRPSRTRRATSDAARRRTAPRPPIAVAGAPAPATDTVRGADHRPSAPRRAEITTRPEPGADATGARTHAATASPAPLRATAGARSSALSRVSVTGTPHAAAAVAGTAAAVTAAARVRTIGRIRATLPASGPGAEGRGRHRGHAAPGPGAPLTRCCAPGCPPAPGPTATGC